MAVTLHNASGGILCTMSLGSDSQVQPNFFFHASALFQNYPSGSFPQNCRAVLAEAVAIGFQVQGTNTSTSFSIDNIHLLPSNVVVSGASHCTHRCFSSSTVVTFTPTHVTSQKLALTQNLLPCRVLQSCTHSYDMYNGFTTGLELYIFLQQQCSPACACAASASGTGVNGTLPLQNCYIYQGVNTTEVRPQVCASPDILCQFATRHL